jgi:alpha-2-macroglobulin
MRLTTCLVFNLLFAAAAFSETVPTSPPQVEFFSPQGTVKGVRQVAARFSDPMVAFGDPRLPEPFQIDCPESGKTRWADMYNWIYDFARDLPAGVVCRFTLKEDLKTLDRQAIGGERQFSFSAGGPAIRASLPAEGESSIDENQVFILALDTEAEPGSMTTHVRCEIDGIAEQIGVELLSGEARERVLQQRRLFGYDYVRLLSADNHPLSIEERKAREAGLVVLKCQRTLPPATNVRLVWGVGIKSMAGVATEQDQKLAFTSRSSFTARFSCRRVKPEAECLPMLPMYVTFSAQVAAEQAERIQLKGPVSTALQ